MTDITNVRFTLAAPWERKSGLLGYTSFVYGGIRLDSITVRRTLDGRLTLAYPERRNAKGKSYSIMRPIDESAQIVIEDRVFEELSDILGAMNQ